MQDPVMYKLFVKMAWAIGGTALIVALCTQSILPIIVAVIAVFVLLGFINGFEKTKTQNRRQRRRPARR